MTDAPPPPAPEPTPPPEGSPEESAKSFRLPKWAIAAGSVAAIATVGVVAGTNYFVRTRLSPIVERALTNLLDRPVEMGAVTGFGMTSVTFDETALPATDTDRSFAQIPSVTANFNPLQAIGGQLDLNVTLNRPTLSLIQAEDGQWLDIALNAEPSDGFSVQLDRLNIESGTVRLVPAPDSAVADEVELPDRATAPESEPDAPDPNSPEPAPEASPDISAEDSSGATSLEELNQSDLDAGDLFLPELPELEAIEPDAADSDDATPDETPSESSGENSDETSEPAEPEVETVTAPGAIELPALDELPDPPTAVRLFDVEGEVDIEDGGDRVAFEAVGKNGQFGRLDVRGEMETQSGAIAIELAALNVAGEALTTALPLPFDLYGGRLFANLQLALDANNLGEIPLMRGTARGTDVLATIDNAPQPIYIESTQLAFQDRQIAIEDTTAQYGPLPVAIERGLLDLERGYEIPIAVPPVDWRVARQAVLPDFAIGGFGEIAAQLILRGELEQPILIGEARSTSPLEIDRLALNELDARFAYSIATSEFILEQVNATPASGGSIQAAMQLAIPTDETTQPQALIEFALADINADAIAFDYGGSLPIDRVSARGQVQAQNGAYRISVPQIQIGAGTGRAIALIQGDRWEAEVAANNVRLDPSLLAGAPVALGAVGARAQLAGSLDFFSSPDLATIAAQGQGATTVNGQPTSFGFQLERGRWRAESQLDNLPVTAFVALPAPLNQLDIGGFSGAAVAEGVARGLQVIPTNVGGSGQLAVEGGTVAGNLTLAGNRWEGQVGLANVGLAKLLPSNLPLRSPRLNAPQLAIAGTTDFDLGSISALGEFAIGAENGGLGGAVEVANGGWNVDIAQFGLPVPDPWGDLFPMAVNTDRPSQLSGSLTDFSPSAIAGQIAALLPSSEIDPEAGQLTDGISVALQLDRDRWQAQVGIPPQSLDALIPDGTIEQFTDGRAQVDIGGLVAGGLEVSGGWAGAIPAGIEIGGGALRLDDLTLNGETVSERLEGSLVRGSLPASLEAQLFSEVANLYGTPSTASADDLTLLLEKPFDPALPVVADERDRVLVRLGSDLSPKLFEAQLGELQVAGRCIGDRCDVNAERFPLTWLDLQPVPGRGRVGGFASFDGQVTADGSGFSGAVSWTEPQWGSVLADELFGDLSWSDRRLNFEALTLTRDETRYQFDGAIDWLEDPALGIKVSVRDGDLQDLLELLQWSDFEDLSRGFAPPALGTVDDLDVAAVGDLELSILDRVRRLVEIELLRDRQGEQTIGRAPVPNLLDLDGRFNAEIDVGGTLSDPALDFAASGRDWEWLPYAFPELQVSGRYRDRQLNLDPSWITAILEPDTVTRLDLSGTFTPDRQAADAQLQNLPLSFVGEAANLPAQFRTAGRLGVEATLAGSQADPQIDGTLHLEEGRLNVQPVNLDRGSFSYDNGRLDFGGELLTEAPIGSVAEDINDAGSDRSTAVTVSGSAPFLFPGATAIDSDDSFAVTLDTRDDGMAFLNALTDSVAWLGGQGRANITLLGRRRDGIFKLEQTLGTAQIDGATLASPQLPEPLTDVRGAIELADDRITVTDLVGNFEQGAVKATGNLALVNPFDPESKLTVVLDRVALNLKRLYSGGIDGRIDITGSAFLPSLGGYLTLSDGLVFLPDPNAPAAAQPFENGQIIRYDNLQIQLDRNIRLVSPPTLDFIADGRLIINGLFDTPSPAGKIFLRDGRVNLFTTAFTLDRSRFNTAIFDPQFGTDPILDVQMRTSIAETTRNRLVSSIDATDNSRARELQETAIERGSVETIRITADVQGRASQLFDRLELSSSPARPELELYSLIGGGVSENTEGGGTVALASSALLTQVQAIVGRALGLRDFRLFPAFDPRTSSLGLGAEVGVRLNDRLSTSFQAILDHDTSFRFGARYRINDSVTLGGSTDFQGDDRGTIEFQFRF